MEFPRVFKMYRGYDETGVSGTGYILTGCIFPGGTTVVKWNVPNMPNSVAIYASYKAFRIIHVESHPSNQTKIEFLNSYGHKI